MIEILSEKPQVIALCVFSPGARGYILLGNLKTIFLVYVFLHLQHFICAACTADSLEGFNSDLSSIIKRNKITGSKILSNFFFILAKTFNLIQQSLHFRVLL